MTAKVLRRFAELWVVGFLTLMLISVGRHVFFLAPTVERGFADVQAWFNPSAPQTYLFPLVVISPALAAIYLSLRLRKRRSAK